jgi:hypothetical protein
MKSQKKFLGNKQGWIRIIEAFVSIMLIAGVLLIVINREYPKEDSSVKIYEKETEILRGIEINDSLREDILNAPLPAEWADFETAGLINVKNKIIAKTPNYLNCEAKLCEINENCEINPEVSEDIYADSAGIFADTFNYAPRQLRIFCWEK